MKRILISGYYGFNNMGDEAILRVMIENLRTHLQDVELTILSHDPADTAKRYGVNSVDRMNPFAILREVKRCDLLISGGGSLLQDTTSHRSLMYYLFIINLAHKMGKKVFLYSQGIGPLLTPKNQKRTRRSLENVDGIVVRDQQSKRLLEKIGLDVSSVYVTTDPVLRSKRPDLRKGEVLLRKEGCPRKTQERIRVAWAMKPDPGGSDFRLRQEDAIRWLLQERNADVVLIPFHEDQDSIVAQQMAADLGDGVTLLKGHYLSEDLLSVVGNMDLMVGVRLHALIYAAVMGVPMLGISYDPKIDAFLGTLGMSPVSNVEEFTVERFAPAFDRTLALRAEVSKSICANVQLNKQSLDINEKLIAELLKG